MFQVHKGKIQSTLIVIDHQGELRICANLNDNSMYQRNQTYKLLAAREINNQ